MEFHNVAISPEHMSRKTNLICRSCFSVPAQSNLDRMQVKIFMVEILLFYICLGVSDIQVQAGWRLLAGAQRLTDVSVLVQVGLFPPWLY